VKKREKKEKRKEKKRKEKKIKNGTGKNNEGRGYFMTTTIKPFILLLRVWGEKKKLHQNYKLSRLDLVVRLHHVVIALVKKRDYYCKRVVASCFLLS